MTADGSFSSNYLQYLPAIFSEDPFLARFLLAFEKILTGLQGSENEPERGLEQIIADIPTLFDPDETPEEFLDWLGAGSEAAIPRQHRQAVSLARHQTEPRGTVEDLLPRAGGDP